MRHILVSVSADRILRFWDSFHGSLLAEIFTGHKSGETVVALCANPSNTCVVTGDTLGFIKVNS